MRTDRSGLATRRIASMRRSAGAFTAALQALPMRQREAGCTCFLPGLVGAGSCDGDAYLGRIGAATLRRGKAKLRELLEGWRRSRILIPSTTICARTLNSSAGWDAGRAPSLRALQPAREWNARRLATTDRRGRDRRCGDDRRVFLLHRPSEQARFDREAIARGDAVGSTDHVFARAGWQTASGSNQFYPSTAAMKNSIPSHCFRTIMRSGRLFGGASRPLQSLRFPPIS